MLVLGIDEAGKGPVIGPMIICGYLVKEKTIPSLSKLGVKDSKLLSHEKRMALDKKLRKLAKDFILLSIAPNDIDSLRAETNLNKIEIEHIQKIINLLEPDKVIIDAFEYNTNRFASKVRAKISRDVELVAENYADRNHPPVAAASILAKVERERAIEKIKKDIGIDFGTGYPSDERTISFLRKWIDNKDSRHDFIRKSWMTFEVIRKEKEQKKLMDF